MSLSIWFKTETAIKHSGFSRAEVKVRADAVTAVFAGSGNAQLIPGQV